MITNDQDLITLGVTHRIRNARPHWKKNRLLLWLFERVMA